MTARSLPPELQAYLDSIVDRCRHHYGARLRSVVLYGSVARTTFSATSDVDLLVVLADSTTSLGQRITEFIRGVADAPGIESAADTLRQMGLPCRVEPIILTVSELAAHPPLLLDLTEDAVVLQDRDGVFAREIGRVAERLRELGSQRIWLDGDRWYWVLTPEIRLGDVIVI